jgi:glutathione-regulated potassium-efflux system ancillary protein KefF
MIQLIYAHPYPQRSRANSILLEAVRHLPGLEVRVLYDLYPDFAIDVDTEQRALLQAHVIVWQHPMYWYSVPPLLKLWFDKVLAHGWAYGEDAAALRDKACQWVVTTGGDTAAFQPEGMHNHLFESFVPPIKQTAIFCKMRWEPPLVVHGAHRVSDKELHEAGERYRERLEALALAAGMEDSHG